MKKLIIIALMGLVPASAFAVTPGDVIGSIFEFILDHINHKADGTVDTTQKVILKKNNGNLILARVYLKKPAGSTDSVSLPKCSNTANERVDRIRLKVAENAAHINSVTFTYQNGTSQTAQVDDDFNKGENSGWVNFGVDRCIRKISIKGHSNGAAAKAVSAVTFVGRIAK